MIVESTTQLAKGAKASCAFEASEVIKEISHTPWLKKQGKERKAILTWDVKSAMLKNIKHCN